MSSLDACIYTVIAILGVAYPILLQVISRLDDKYSSVQAVGLFEQETERKWFEYLLISSSGAVFLWFLNLPAPACLVDATGWAGWVLAHSALGLVYLTTLGLVIFFFLLTRKTITYYNTQKLAGYLQAGYRKNRRNERHFEVLSDVFLSSLTARYSPVLPEIADFFSEQFSIKRTLEQTAAGTAAEETAVVYPTAYYQLTYRSTEELALLGNRKHQGVTHLATGGGWLLGGNRHHRLSEETYSALWHNLRLALDYGQEDMVYEYWKTAHQHMEFGLPRILPQYEQEEFALRITNEPAIAFRQNEQTRFLEFHQVLGALLLYTSRHNLLRRLFDHTNSSPPRYLLLPSTMTEVFTLFVRYQTRFDRLMPLDLQYRFPNETGVATEGIITNWLLTYVAVLFLRQYTLRGYLVGEEPMAYPTLPEGQPAKKSWRAALPHFRRYVQRVLQNQPLLQNLRLDDLSEAQYREQPVELPLDFIATVEKSVSAAYAQGADELAMSPEKVKKFYADSGHLLEQAAQAVLELAGPDEARTFTQARYLGGRRQLVPKDDFAANPEVDHLNYSTALAGWAGQNLRLNVIRLFISNQTVAYRVRPAELFAALDKLELGEEHLIISLGLDLAYLAGQGQVAGWQPNSYRGSTVQEFKGGGQVGSLLVLKRQELPAMRLLAPDPTEAEKYDLTKISELFNLYATVLDANSLSPEVAAEVRSGNFGEFTEESFASQAVEMLWLLLEFKWQQGAKLVQLIAPYSGEGQAGDLAAIVPFQ